MGTIAPDIAYVALFHPINEEVYAEFVAGFPEDFRYLLVGPIITQINGYAQYAFLWDGSKEGWETSDRADEAREKWIDFMQRRGKFPEIVQVKLGENGQHIYDRSMPDE